MKSNSTLGLRLAYAGACALPAVIVLAIVARAPLSADATEGAASASAGPAKSSGLPINPVAVASGLPPTNAANPPATAGPRPTGPRPRLTLPTGGPTSTDPPPKALEITPQLRGMIDDLKSKLDLHKYHDAVVTFRQLLDAEPRAGESGEVRSSAVKLALYAMDLPAPDPTDAFEGIASKMGPQGLDVLYELATAHGGAKAAVYARDLLSRDAILSKGSPAMRVAWALYLAKTCEDVRKLLGDAAQNGDGRALGRLYLVQAGSNPACVMKTDPDLKSTIDAMRDRGVTQ